jgi:hypothetical protein
MIAIAQNHTQSKKSARSTENKALFKTSANPRAPTRNSRRIRGVIRFMNPGDLVPHETAGSYPAQTAAVPRSTMTTSAVFWAAVGHERLMSQKRAFR